MPGRQWAPDLIPLRGYMRRRDIPRMARELIYQKSRRRAKQAMIALLPTQELEYMLVELINIGDLYFSLLLLRIIMNQRTSAFEAYNFFRTYIRRPLRALALDRSHTIDFRWWPSPSAFASTFRVASYEQLEHLAHHLGSGRYFTNHASICF